MSQTIVGENAAVHYIYINEGAAGHDLNVNLNKTQLAKIQGFGPYHCREDAAGHYIYINEVAAGHDLMWEAWLPMLYDAFQASVYICMNMPSMSLKVISA